MSAKAEEITQQEVEDNTIKVFIGNLAFSTTEETLKTAFADAGAV
jgi:RNA recognition motif-containing protein